MYGYRILYIVITVEIFHQINNEDLIMFITIQRDPWEWTKSKHIVHEDAVGGSGLIGFPLIIAESERDMPEI